MTIVSCQSVRMACVVMDQGLIDGLVLVMLCWRQRMSGWSTGWFCVRGHNLSAGNKVCVRRSCKVSTVWSAGHDLYSTKYSQQTPIWVSYGCLLWVHCMMFVLSLEVKSCLEYDIIIQIKKPDHVTCQMVGQILFNSSPPSAPYMRQWIRSALVQIMTCRLFGAKPLS